MEFRCLALFFSLIVMLMGAQAALPPEVYWERMLPNTPIPKGIREFSKLGFKDIQEQKEISGSLEQLLVWRWPSSKYELQDGVKEIPSQDKTPYGPKSKENVVIREVVPVANHHDDDHSKSTIFFFEEELKRGAKLDMHFRKMKYLAPFLSREITEHIPFSSEKINEILEILTVKPESWNAKNVEKSLEICEEPAMNGEEKHCATSVESMVDFVTSKLGKNVHVTSTEVEIESKSQEFIVKDGVKILAEEETIACHLMNYPYVVFYCHKISNTTAHFVPLEGEDGTRVKAVAVCHKDTSEWNPDSLAMQVLKVKPGTSPVCHFFPDGALLWYAK
ncbi:hypothetical protein V8G54_007243 [Vigna mungo]|uniref:BURP domain-containing protein n=1 Tax=Vigna mungo TaxID=3915 RepID=A0AAQ3S8S7_VIGMU